MPVLACLLPKKEKSTRPYIGIYGRSAPRKLTNGSRLWRIYESLGLWYVLAVIFYITFFPAHVTVVDLAGRVCREGIFQPVGSIISDRRAASFFFVVLT